MRRGGAPHPIGASDAMKVFHCDHCDNLVFFENVRCLSCTRGLAFLPDLGVMGSFDEGAEGVFSAPRSPRTAARRWRRCANYERENVCNWALPAGDENPLCASCRLTQIIPDLSVSGNREAWYRIEVAKRRLIYTLRALDLPLPGRDEEPETGLAFEFLADGVGPDAAPVLTGHAGGVIRLNIAEADDAERERRRLALNEPYRTLLGHFRHESGHYYWDKLVAGTDRLEAFRATFGDERADYAEALRQNYEAGPPSDWQARFISTYAASHPWEDWAETWAHYLHVVDTLETSAQCGLALRPARPGDPSVLVQPPAEAQSAFDRLLADWYPVTYLLNNLNRGLGLADAYPFVLSPVTVAKLRFVHDTITAPRAVREADRSALRTHAHAAKRQKGAGEPRGRRQASRSPKGVAAARQA
ncbi:MAG: putative zinc-binding peptidase [Polyangiaceae bacterium]|nr:putative zinc-binding peptidase [Polyangiaceae bacterium]